jgi:tetratricopeptide (TPR) repeat protein
MRRPLILTLLACGLLVIISPQALAQADDPIAEAQQLGEICAKLRDTGKYDEAIDPCQRLLAIGEKALGSEHPTVALFLNILADVYYLKGDYGKVEPLYQRALAIDEKALGAEHPDVASSLNNLATLYRNRGDYAKAEPLYQRALAIREKVLSSDHPQVAESLGNLASLYMAKEDYSRAVELLMRGQEILESNINAILTSGSEKQKRLYLDTLVGDTYSSVSLGGIHLVWRLAQYEREGAVIRRISTGMFTRETHISTDRYKPFLVSSHAQNESIAAHT